MSRAQRIDNGLFALGSVLFALGAAVALALMVATAAVRATLSDRAVPAPLGDEALGATYAAAVGVLLCALVALVRPTERIERWVGRSSARPSRTPSAPSLDYPALIAQARELGLPESERAWQWASEISRIETRERSERAAVQLVAAALAAARLDEQNVVAAWINEAGGPVLLAPERAAAVNTAARRTLETTLEAEIALAAHRAASTARCGVCGLEHGR